MKIICSGTDVERYEIFLFAPTAYSGVLGHFPHLSDHGFTFRNHYVFSPILGMLMAAWLFLRHGDAEIEMVAPDPV